MKARILLLAGCMFFLPATPSYACGVCVEDKIASVYDHARITSELLQGRVVAFCSIEVSRTFSGDLRTLVTDAFGELDGVAKESLAISLESNTVSFGFDPSRTSIASLLSVARPRLAKSGASVTVLRVMDR